MFSKDLTTAAENQKSQLATFFITPPLPFELRGYSGGGRGGFSSLRMSGVWGGSGFSWSSSTKMTGMPLFKKVRLSLRLNFPRRDFCGKRKWRIWFKQRCQLLRSKFHDSSLFVRLSYKTLVNPSADNFFGIIALSKMLLRPFLTSPGHPYAPVR